MSERWASILSRPDVWLGGLALAAFLALYWAIRGAPIGQSPREPVEPDADPPATSPGRRDRCVAMAAAGAVLVAAGAYVAPQYGIPWAIPVFAAGYGLVMLAMRGARPHRHASPVMRRVVRFSETAVTASLLAGVLVVANVAAFKYGDRPIDLTRERVYSLEPETRSQLRSLRRPLKLTAFYYGRLPQAYLQVLRVRQLLRLFEAESPQSVSIDFVNFHGDRARAEELMRRVPDAAVSSGGVVVELGEGESASRIVVKNSEMFDDPVVSAGDRGPASIASRFRGEYALSAALRRLREGRRPRLAMTTGHGESPPAEMGAGSRGVGILRARLADIGFEVTDLELAHQGVPKETALVMVVGPRSAFTPPEVEKLKAYLAQGGRGLFLLSGREKTGLEDLLKAFNVDLGSALAVEPPPNAPGEPRPTVGALIPGNASHPVVRTLAGQLAIVPGATPLTVLKPPANPAVAAEPILRTGPRAYGEADTSAARLAFDPAKDVPGPLVVGVAVSESGSAGNRGEPDREKPRLVVFSSGDLADNPYVRVGYETNLDLTVNAADWLRGRLDLPPIAPRTRTLARLNPDPNVQARLVLVPSLIAVALILGFGGAVYVARRA